MEEIWKSIGVVKGVDFTGLYEISNFGMPKSLDRWVVNKNGEKQFVKGRNLKVNILKNGYAGVELRKDGKRVFEYIHRLVLQAFIPNPNPELYPFVNHKDENPANNCLDNLEWCDAKYNSNYGTCKERASATLRSHFIPVVKLNLNGDIIDVYYKRKDMLKKDNGASYRRIIYCINNGENIVNGYFFIRLDEYNKLMQNELLDLIKQKQQQKGKNPYTKKPIVLLDLQGNFIKQFDSVSNTASFLNCQPSSVSSCLTGLNKTVKGFKCVYLEDYKTMTNK